MLPAIHIAGIHIPRYSLMVFLGIVAFFVTYFLYVEKGEKLDRITSNRLLFVSILGIAFLGFSAMFFNSLFHTIEAGEIRIGGITWLGGVLGGVPFTVFLIHKLVPKAKGRALYYFSLLVPGLVIGHAFGRLGCFFGGCCYGRVTDSIFGVIFPEGSLAAQQYPGENGASLPVLPTQLFESVFEFVLFFVLVIFRKKLKPYNLLIYFFAYGVFRFSMEFLRGDDRGSTGFALSPSQFICILLLIAAVLILLFYRGILFKGLAQKCAVWQEQAAAAVAVPVRSSRRNPIGEIEELHRLMKAGIISEEEFEEKKAELLKRI